MKKALLVQLFLVVAFLFQGIHSIGQSTAINSNEQNGNIPVPQILENSMAGETEQVSQYKKALSLVAPGEFKPGQNQLAQPAMEPIYTQTVLDPSTAIESSITPVNPVGFKTSAGPSASGSKGWNLLMSEDFEGTFPSGSWSAYPTTGYTDAYWDDSDCRSFGGTKSAWCAAAGTASVACFEDYPNDMQSYLKYGPFDLSDAYDAYIDFYFWLNSESGYDEFAIYVSVDDNNWYGGYWTGTYATWYSYSFDLKNVYILGNVCGEPQVWFAFKFESDNIISEAEGAYVDDIELWTDDTPGDPNLALTGGGFSPNPVNSNEVLSITAEVTNYGSGDAVNAEMHYYLSNDITINTSDCYLGNDFVTLAASQTTTESIDVDLNAIGCVSGGSYYVGVYFVDENNGWYWTTILEVIDYVDQPDIHVNPSSLTIYQTGSNSANAPDGQDPGSTQILGEYEAGHLLVKFKDEVVISKDNLTANDDAINGLFDSYSVSGISHVFPVNDKNIALKNQFGLYSIYCLEIDKSSDMQEVIAAFEDNPLVEYAEPDYLYFADLVPDDPLYPEQWGLKNTGQAQPYGGGGDVGTPGADINAEPAWDIQTGSSDVTVAILDEGVDLTHPEFDGRLLPGYDFIDNDDDPSPQGDGAHGTACAGIAAAANDGVGTVGVAWNVMILPVRVLGPSGGTNLQVSSGITFAADEGAHIISMSLGGGSYSSTMETAVDYAYALDILLLASAGNNNSDNGTTPQYPCSYDNCISVGALSPCNDRKTPTTCDGEFWWGSNYGGGLDFMAPGTRIYTTDISGSAGYTSGDYTTTFNGTSSACPFAAGIAALIKSENPSLTNAEIWTIMQNSCVDLGTSGYDDDTGFGRLDAYQALLLASGVGTGNELTINNVGTLNLTISNITAGDTWLSTSGYPATPFDIAPGSSQVVTVDINWTQLGNVQSSSTITITSNDPDEAAVIVPVTAIPQELPDLVVQDQDITPASVSPGESVTATCLVYNQGNADAGASQLKYYLSQNTTWEASDVYLNFDNVPALAQGSGSAQTEDLLVPLGTPAGIYYVLFFADADLEVDESIENNNVSYVQLTVAAPFITLDPLSDDVGSAGGSTTVDVSSNVSWTVSETCDWLSVTPTSGSNDGSFTVTYDENLSTEPRTCLIEVSGEGESATYTLNQSGAIPYITVDPTSQDVGYEQGSLTVTIESNIAWAVSETCDWLESDPVSGQNSGTILLSYDENTSAEIRSCVITIGDGNVSAEVEINQDGTTSVGDALAKNQIKIYPNPASDFITIELGELSMHQYSLRMVDLLGSVVYNKQFSVDNRQETRKVNISAFAQGIYYLQLVNSDGKVVKTDRFVKH